MISIERTYNVGQYQSLKLWFNLPIDTTDFQSVKKGILYLTLLSDIAYYNYISSSPVLNNSLNKDVISQLKSSISDLLKDVKFEVEIQEKKGEE